MQEGPSTVKSYHCAGCTHLHTKYWKFYGENDDIDSGTDATCTKENKHISSYWYSGNHTPQWCPFLESIEHELSV